MARLQCVSVVLALALPAACGLRAEQETQQALGGSHGGGCDVNTLTENYADEEKDMLGDNECKCFTEEYTWEDVTDEESCTGTEARKAVCRWESGKCAPFEVCTELPLAADPPGCQDIEGLGCVSPNPRPLALGEGDVSKVALLTNPKDEVCYFNSAILQLFGGANDLVPHLHGDGNGDACHASIRRSLARVVRAMRSQRQVSEDDYVRRMMQCIRVDCADKPDSEMMLHLAKKDKPFGESIGVLRLLLLPALGISYEQRMVDLQACSDTPSLVQCLETELDSVSATTSAPTVANPELLIFSFTQREGNTWPAGLKFHSPQQKLTVKGVSYTMWAGTVASWMHEMSWTLHPAEDPKLTIYNDQESPYGIREFADVNAGVTDMLNPEVRLKTAIFKRDPA